MRVRHWASFPVVTADRKESVISIAKKMHDFHVGDVIITEGEYPVGIVTDRDLVIEVMAKDLSPEDTTAEEVMTDELVVADDSETVDRTLELMKRNGVRRIPLVDRSGHLTGIVSMDDLLGNTPENTETVRTLPKIQRNWEKEVRR